MSDHHDEIVIPRGAIVAAASLVLLSLALAFVARQTDIGATRLTLSPPAETVRIVFSDTADGGIVVSDADRGRELQRHGPNDGGFVGIGPAAPFELSRDAAGRAVLADPQTGGVITLSAFGPGNAAAFAELLDKGRRTP
jgi:hypothetical protein